MSIFISAYRNRTCLQQVTITDSDGNTVTFANGDVMRIKIGEAGKTPELDLDSAEASEAGSTVEAANPSDVLFHEDDLTFDAKVYDLEASIWDASQSVLKHADKGVFVLHETQTGEVGDGS